jgi:hypothetical protein
VHFIVMLSFGTLLALEETSLSTTTATVGGTTSTSESSSQQHQNQFLCQDILVCGVCQREFALSDILKFISHKVNSCSNKENCRFDTYNNRSDDELDNNEDQLPVISDTNEVNNADDVSNASNIESSSSSAVINLRKQTPSIISTSQRHKLIKLRHHRVHNAHNVHNHSQQNRNVHQSQCQTNEISRSTPGEKQTVDAYTNTINTGN